MVFKVRQIVRAFVVCSLAFILVSTQALAAQSVSSNSPIVQPSELQNAIAQSASARKKNLEQVRSFFASAPVRSVLNKARFHSNQIQRALPSLDSADLAKLAARTAAVQKDFAAGALSNQDLTYVVIALGTAVVILVIVAAR